MGERAGQRLLNYHMVRGALSDTSHAPGLRFRLVETSHDGTRRYYDAGRALWGTTPADLARQLGDLAEALTRPVLVERDGRLVEETP